MKYNQMCLVGATSILIAFLFTILIRKLFQGGKMQKIDWDMATITAGDYTVEFMISRENYDSWNELYYNKPNGPFEQGKSPGFALKEYLKSEIEENLFRWIRQNPNVLEMDEKKKKKKGKKKLKKKDAEDLRPRIADIVFSFNNRKLIHALRARGKKIAYNDFDGMREENKKI